MKKAGILFLFFTLVFGLHAQAQQWQATQLDMQWLGFKVFLQKK
jgi:hypothetical protein